MDARPTSTPKDAQPLLMTELVDGSPGLPSFFFFHCYGDHRDLHSFPTRRSSDLLCLFRSRLRLLNPYVGIGCARGLARSEEHTSELQSLRHLVCRLLLEKKK